MKNRLRAVAVMIAMGTLAGFAQQAPPAGSGRGGGGDGRAAQAGRGTAQQPAAPAVPSISQRPAGSSLGTIRVGAADNNQWFGWRVAMPSTAIKPLNLSEALARADLLSVTSVEASSAQTVSAEIPKKLDYRLQTGERNAINYRLRELNQQILAYDVDGLPPDAPTRRKVFEFAKALGIPTIVVAAGTTSLVDLEKLAEEFEINIALESKGDPKAVLSALDGRGKRMGVAADLGAWIHEGIKPVDGLAAVKDKLLIVKAADRSALGAKGRAVALGDGVGRNWRVLSRGVQGGCETAGHHRGVFGHDRSRHGEEPERLRKSDVARHGGARQPDARDAGGADSRRRSFGSRHAEADRRRHAAPGHREAGEAPETAGHRYPDVFRARHNPARQPVDRADGEVHRGIRTTFSNDLSLLKYPKIKEFDAVYLNNVCGMVHNDPDVREGILRFVREGGGIGGHHAVTFANNNWPEFAEMMGGWAGEHHTEKQVIKIDDPNSPLTKSFGSASFDYTDEFYQFPPSAPYSREKQHILLSIDVEKSDRATGNRFCAKCTRPDQDYGLAWIKTYGKGRTYFTPLGHTNTFYTETRWTQHLLAAIQYILGDLEADATPSAKLAGKGSR
jgi:type 1 glutamine amidotransferase